LKIKSKLEKFILHKQIESSFIADGEYFGNNLFKKLKHWWFKVEAKFWNLVYK